METVEDIIDVLSNGTVSPAYIAAWLCSETEKIKGMLESRPDLFRPEGVKWSLVTPVPPQPNYQPSYVHFFDEYEQRTDTPEPLDD